MENQYFFYEEWARHLKAQRTAFMQWIQGAGCPCNEARILHLMVVMPLPEDEGMVLRTYDTLKSLGQGQSMPNQRALHAGEEKGLERQQAWDARYATLSPEEKTNRLWAPGLGARPRAPLSPIVQDAQKVKELTLDKDGVLMQDGKSLGLKVLICKMATPNHSGQPALGASYDIYIHSKLLMVDDCFMTLGSANLNLRSMAADSEINLATDSIEHVRPFRQRVWGMQTGGEHDGDDGSPQKVSDTFDKWKNLSAYNKSKVNNGELFAGFLVQFEDKRTAMHRHG